MGVGVGVGVGWEMVCSERSDNATEKHIAIKHEKIICDSIRENYERIDAIIIVPRFKYEDKCA